MNAIAIAISASLVLGAFNTVGTATETAAPTEVDLSVLDALTAPHSAGSSLFTVVGCAGCPKCEPKTPTLNSPAQLTVPATSSGQPANSQVYLEYRMPSHTPGECKDDSNSACKDTNCKFTLSYKLSGTVGSSYGFGVQATFPPSTPPNSGGYQSPGDIFVAEWKDITKPCGQDENFDIVIDFYNFPAGTLIVGATITKTSVLGCNPCTVTPN